MTNEREALIERLLAPEADDYSGHKMEEAATQLRADGERLAKAEAALRDAHRAITSLDEDALGEVITGYTHHGDPEAYPIRAELLAKIDAALARPQVKP